MVRGIHIERVADDVLDAPSMRVCREMERRFEAAPGIAERVLLAVTPTSPRHLWITLLSVDRPLRGIGGETLDALCHASDDHAVTLELQAISKDKGLDQDALLSFYARRGFEPNTRTARTNAMRREPRAMPHGAAAVVPMRVPA